MAYELFKFGTVLSTQLSEYSRTFRADILRIVNIYMDFRDLDLKWMFSEAKWGKGWCDDDPATNSFSLLGVFTSVPILVKID